MKHQKPAFWFRQTPKRAGGFHRWPFKSHLDVSSASRAQGYHRSPLFGRLYLLLPTPVTGCMWVWRRMTVCVDCKGCFRLQANALRLDGSISWPTSAAEDSRATRSESVQLAVAFCFSFCLLAPFFLLSPVPWMLSAASTCCRSCRTCRWQVEVERRWVPSAPPPPPTTRRCPPARRRAPTTGAARTAPSWTPLGFFCKGSSPWWLSARWCVSVSYPPPSTTQRLCLRYPTPAARWNTFRPIASPA